MAENKNKKGLDAFAGRKVGGSEKYRKHHLEAVRIERANEADKRIAEFFAQPKTLDWARRAFAFCDEEERNGKEYADICEGLKTLSRIRSEAQILIDAENERLRKIEEEKEKKRLEEEAKEAERLRKIEEEKQRKAEQEAEQRRQLELLKRQQELKEMAEEAEFIADIEKIISSLSRDVRNASWIEGVNNTLAIAQGLEKRAYDKIKNRYLLEGFKKEIEDVQLAIDLDDEILDLQNARNKNKAWASKVFGLEGELDGKHEKYLTQKPTYFKILTLAGRVYYAGELDSLQDFITRVEKGQGASFVAKIDEVKNTASKLADQILIEDYITSFDSRFQKAVSTVNGIIADNEKREREAKRQFQEAERKRKQKEKEEEAKAKAEADRIAREKKAEADRIEKERLAEIERINKIKREEEERIRKLAEMKAKRRKLIENVAVAVLFVAVIVVGILTKDVVRSLVLGVGLTLIVSYVYFRLAKLFYDNNDEEIRAIVFTILTLAELVLGIIFLFVDRNQAGKSLDIVSLSLAVGIIAQCFITYFVSDNGRYVEDLECDLMTAHSVLTGALLGFSLFLVTGAYIWSALIGGAVIVGGGVISFFLNDGFSSDMYSVGLWLVILNAVLSVLGCVLMCLGHWNFYIMGAFLVVMGAVMSFIFGDQDIDGGFLVGSIAAIAGFICIGIGIAICLA